MVDELELFREHLRDRGFKEPTVTTKYKLIRTLRKRSSNLWDSDEVTQVVKDANLGNRRKNNAFYAYRDWCRWKGFDYEFDKLREEASPLPYIPSEKEIDQLIATCNPCYASYLQTMKETAFRPTEVLNLKVKDIDFERGIITLNKPLKWSNPRQKKISDKLLVMIRRTAGSKNSDERVWQYTYNSMHRTFYMKRRQLSEKLENPNFIKISFKTFRH
ncbi:MAG: tyrosine-type recombinase/integrase [Promethearchaeota archaeon]